MKRNSKFTLITLTSACLFCSVPVFATPTTITVSTGNIQKTLYYNGTVAPIVNVPVISPTAGVVSKMYFSYGQMIQKGQKMLSVTSTKVLDNLRSAKVAYLNALQDYNNTKNWTASSDYINAENSLNRAIRTYNQSHNTYEENVHLYKLGIISKDQLEQSKNSNEDNLASLKQSKRNFEKITAKGKGNYLLIKKLQFETAQDKYKSLESQVDSTTIKAPAGGIVLVPSTNNGNSDSSSSNDNTSSSKLQVGSTIAYQEVLMNIGDMSGLKVSFNVPEIDINKLKKGMTATVTGSGFPGITLSGSIISVGAQANQGSGSSLPTFPVVVDVPKLYSDAAKLIRSGMDASIAIDVSKKTSHFMVPVSAIHHAKGTSYVYVYNPDNKKSVKTTVTTGTVGVKNVEVLSGLKSGDEVVINNGDSK